MNKNKSLAAAAAMLDEYPKAENFHVTTDGRVFVKPALASAHAVTLSAGNPTVETITRAEAEEFASSVPVADVPKPENSENGGKVLTEEEIIQANIDRMETVEKRVTELREQIYEIETAEGDVDDAKLPSLKEELLKLEAELESLQK